MYSSWLCTLQAKRTSSRMHFPATDSATSRTDCMRDTASHCNHLQNRKVALHFIQPQQRGRMSYSLHSIRFAEKGTLLAQQVAQLRRAFTPAWLFRTAQVSRSPPRLGGRLNWERSKTEDGSGLHRRGPLRALPAKTADRLLLLQSCKGS